MDKTNEPPTELSTELSTDNESINEEEKIEKPKKPRPPATPAQIEARKKNFEKMLKKRTEESLALAQKKVEDKLKKKEERKAGKAGNSSFPCDPIQPIDTPKPVIKKHGSVREQRVPDDEYDIIEEHITKKPKKKRIIYKEESDSEEEVIIRRKKPVDILLEKYNKTDDNQYGVGGERRVPSVEPVKEEPKKISQLIRFF